MSYTRYQPVFLDLNGRLCVVVGGGAIAFEKVTALAESGARIRIVSPRLSPGLAEMVRQSTAVSWRQKDFEVTDLEGAFLVIGATDDPEVNRQVATIAEGQGKLANAVDDPANCNFIFGAVAKSGPIQVAVSSAGCSPVIAQNVRNEIQQTILTLELGELAEFLGEWRPAVKESIESFQDRKHFWQKVVASKVPSLLASGNTREAEREFLNLLDKEVGAVLRESA